MSRFALLGWLLLCATVATGNNKKGSCADGCVNPFHIVCLSGYGVPAASNLDDPSRG